MIDIKITKEILSLDEAYDIVLDDACGAICIFVGTTRNHNNGKSVIKLDFEAYHSMAINEMTKIAEQAKSQFQIEKVAIYHREGTVAITDRAVIIAVSSHHRKEAFDACQFCIDQLKLTVPIWKKESLVDGSYWVGSRP